MVLKWDRLFVRLFRRRAVSHTNSAGYLALICCNFLVRFFPLTTNGSTGDENANPFIGVC